MYWNESIECMDRDQLREIQSRRLKKIVNYCYHNTPFYRKKFQETIEIFENNGYNINVVSTICNATDERQTEAENIAKKADVMIVIGGASSSNSRKLYEICAKECTNTYFIQTLDDLHLELPQEVKIVGITAGASTPKNIIEEVQNYVRTNI